MVLPLILYGAGLGVISLGTWAFTSYENAQIQEEKTKQAEIQLETIKASPQVAVSSSANVWDSINKNLPLVVFLVALIVVGVFVAKRKK